MIYVVEQSFQKSLEEIVLSNECLSLIWIKIIGEMSHRKSLGAVKLPNLEHWTYIGTPKNKGFYRVVLIFYEKK